MMRFLVLLLCLMSAGKATARVDTAIERARDWLVAQQRADGAIVDAANPLFETWESVIAARALVHSRDHAHVAALQRSLEFLSAQRNADGLLCHNRRCRQATCIETSAEYLQLLIDVGQRAQAAARWPALVAHQQADGRFLVGNPDVRERLDYASVTAFVVAVGERLHIDDDAMKHARIWLLEQQSASGDFGAAWEYYGTPAYALWPVLRGLSGNAGAQRKARLRMLAWAGNSQNDDGSWALAATGSARHVSTALDTALMLLALNQTAAPRDVIAPAEAALLQLQSPDGHWHGGWFPIPSVRYQKREDVFATAIAILALGDRRRAR